MIQRSGFPNISIKLYQDYEAFLSSRFIELGATFVTLTLRDSLRGINEGLLQIYDNKLIHTRMTGKEVVQISLSTANTEKVLNRVYGISHDGLTIDQKNDNIITFQLRSYHEVQNLKFGRGTETNALNNLQSMIDAIYKDCPIWKPALQGINVFIPSCPWTSTVKDYQDFLRTHGQAVDSADFVYCWEDFNGITLTDHESVLKQEPRPCVVVEPTLLGQFNDQNQYTSVYDFEWMTKTNAKNKNSFSNVTYTTVDFLSKQYNKIVIGAGDNVAHFVHGGALNSMTYKNAMLEGRKLAVMSQYDSYAKATCHGDFSFCPSMKLRFYDHKDQLRSDFIVDEVVHEISREQSLTHLYMFSGSETYQDVKFEGKI